MPLDSRKILLDFLNPHQPFRFMGSRRYSTLIAAFRDCRMYTKREISSGNYNPKIEYGNEGNWLGAIGYFTILDQIGSCYMPIGEPEPDKNTNSIKFAIEKFGFDLINNDIHKLHALVALRNAFTHDFNLLNIPRNKSLANLQQHKFTVVAEVSDDWIVKLPEELWDGNIEEKDFYNTSDSTFVNLFGIGNLTELIFSRITELVQEDRIDLRIPILRLINKYTFVTSEHPIK